MQSEELTQKQTLKANEEKWGASLMNAGWTCVPSVIIDRQKALGLDSVDINILLVLAKHWWVKDRLPYPSKKTIAETIGISPRTVQRRIAELETANLIQREKRFDHGKGQTTNRYNLNGLIQATAAYAEEAIEAKNNKVEERKARLKRKRPVSLKD